MAINAGVSCNLLAEAKEQTGVAIMSSREMSSPESTLAMCLDHTILKADATSTEISKLCDEAIEYGFRTICVNSSKVGLAAKLLNGHTTEPIAVVGFPLGAGTSSAKAFETKEAIKEGAKEIDMVVNVGALKDKDYAYVLHDIQAVVKAANHTPVKVILETCLLSKEEKIIACAISKAAGAAFVKTSTGFSKSGATVEDVALMRHIVGNNMGVKASGGVRTKEDALKMIAAGASRIGASKSVQIVSGEKKTVVNTKIIEKEAY